MRRNHTGHRMGECHQRAKLTDDQVRELRRLREAGATYRELGERFGCSLWTARDIATYTTRPA